MVYLSKAFGVYIDNRGMARIIDNFSTRRTIRLSTDDVIAIVKEYQSIVGKTRDYQGIRAALDNRIIFLPEEM